MRCANVLGGAVLALLVGASPARAIGTLADDAVWGPMRGASALCHNVGLDQAVPAAGRARLAKASKLFHKADELAVTQQYLKSFAKAASALSVMLPSRSTQQVFQVIFATGNSTSSAARLVLDCAITEVSVGHPAEAAEARSHFDQADAKRTNGDFKGALKLYRKAYAKIAKFVVL